MRKRLKGWMEGGWRGEGDEPHAWFTRKIRGRDSKSVITVRTTSYAGSHPIRQKGCEPPLSPSNGTREGRKKTGANISRWLFSSRPATKSNLLSLSFSLSLSLSLLVVFHVSICFSISRLSSLTLAWKGFSISVNDKNLGLRINVLVFLRGLILSRWGSDGVFLFILESKNCSSYWTFKNKNGTEWYGNTLIVIEEICLRLCLFELRVTRWRCRIQYGRNTYFALCHYQWLKIYFDFSKFWNLN